MELNPIERLFNRVGKFFRQLFSAMGLVSLLIGGLTVFFGERCAKRCEMCPTMEQSAQP